MFSRRGPTLGRAALCDVHQMSAQIGNAQALAYFYCLTVDASCCSNVLTDTPSFPSSCPFFPPPSPACRHCRRRASMVTRSPALRAHSTLMTGAPASASSPRHPPPRHAGAIGKAEKHGGMGVGSGKKRLTRRSSFPTKECFVTSSYGRSLLKNASHLPPPRGIPRAVTPRRDWPCCSLAFHGSVSRSVTR